MNQVARRVTTVAMVAVAMILVLAATPAYAAPLGPLLENAARTLPRMQPSELRLPSVRLAPVREPEYGLTGQTAIERLDAAKAQELNAVDSAVATVETKAGSSEGASVLKETVKDCAKEAFKKVAEDYATAYQEGTEYPDFGDAFYYATNGCLSSKFPYAPDEAVAGVANFITGRVAEPAHGAVAAAPTAFANWLATTGDEVHARLPAAAQPPTAERPHPGAGSGSSSAWVLIAVGLAVVAIVGSVAYHRSHRRA